MYKVKRMVDIGDVEVEASGDNILEVITKDAEPFKLTLADAEERDKWMRDIRHLTEEKQRSRSTCSLRDSPHPPSIFALLTSYLVLFAMTLRVPCTAFLLLCSLMQCDANLVQCSVLRCWRRSSARNGRRAFLSC